MLNFNTRYVKKFNIKILATVDFNTRFLLWKINARDVMCCNIRYHDPIPIGATTCVLLHFEALLSLDV